MKIRHIQRSVRTQRHERAVGDAPSLGRVNRMPRGASNAPSKRRRRGPDDRRGEAKGNRRVVLIVWSTTLAVATCLALLAALWFWRKERQSVDSATASASLQSGLLSAVEERIASRFPSPTEDEALRLVKTALELRQEADAPRYFRLGRGGASHAIEFLSSLAKTEGPATRFDWLSSMDANGLLIDGVLISWESSGKPRNRLALLTPDDQGVWRIDFDAFAREVDPSWDELLNKNAAEARVRVIVAKDSYFNGPFREEDGWLCFGMASPDMDEVLSGYCRKDSPQARAMAQILEEDPVETSSAAMTAARVIKRAILQIRRVDRGGPRQFEITKVLAEDWVLSGKPFEESFR